jgi:hypothetical protein
MSSVEGLIAEIKRFGAEPKRLAAKRNEKTLAKEKRRVRMLRQYLERLHNSACHPNGPEVAIGYVTTLPDSDGWEQPIEIWSGDPDVEADESSDAAERKSKFETSKQKNLATPKRAMPRRKAVVKQNQKAAPLQGTLFMLCVPPRRPQYRWAETARVYGEGASVNCCAAFGMMTPPQGAEEALHFAVRLLFTDQKTAANGVTEGAIGWNLVGGASYG